MQPTLIYEPMPPLLPELAQAQPDNLTARWQKLSQPWRDSQYRTWLNGQRLYSLSKVLRDLDLKPSFGDTDLAVLLNAANRGKLTEQYCYQLMRGESVTVRAKHTGSLQNDVSERVQAFYRWKQAYTPEYVDSQTFCWSKTDRIAWMRDLRVRIDGELWLIDIKCTSKPEKDWLLQIGCGLSYDTDGATRGAILQLKPTMNKQGYKLREYDAQQVKAYWRRTVERWHSNRDFANLRVELGFDDAEGGDGLGSDGDD